MPTSIEREKKSVFIPPGSKDLHPDADLAELEGHGLTPTFQTPLRGVIYRVERHRDEAAYGRGVDEQPSPVLPEVRDEGLGDPDGAHEVGLDAALDLLVGQPFERAGDSVAGIVEDDIHRTGRDRPGHGGLDLGRIGHVERKQLDARQAGQFGLRFGPPHGGQHAPSPRGEQFRRGVTKAG
ncbi:hypothetical protein P9209_13450 [Prescottella defluvii]|nr:hypothetical protein P9209_13450 [Prescottella defluvii]